MRKSIFPVLLYCVLVPAITAAQSNGVVFFKGAKQENREKLYRNIVNNTITKNLSLPLNADTEENWATAFSGVELLRFTAPWIDNKISTAVDSIQSRSDDFQRDLLELLFARYPGRFNRQISLLLAHSSNAKVFALAAEYLGIERMTAPERNLIKTRARTLLHSPADSAIIGQLIARLAPANTSPCSTVEAVTQWSFLPGKRVLYSFQRKNRNYPGIAVVRDSSGKFVRMANGTLFSVPQLARSLSGLPFFLTNGNTPQGIFRMYGFDTSKSLFIGPTTNIQLTMPVETSLRHFFNDSTIVDTIWNEAWYRKLLPRNLEHCAAMFEAFYAGKAGRTEIIAHGTTVDPAYYAGEPFYPQTPTMGCLCTKETWNPADGSRGESDQQKLVNAVQLAGGPDGYCVVIDIDDEKRAVTLADILPFINQPAAP